MREGALQRHISCPKDSPGLLPANLERLPARRKCRWQFRAGKDGKSDFDRLHSRANDHQVFLYAFDLLELNGDDYRQHPLEKRKSKLEKLLSRSDGIRFSEHIDGDGQNYFCTCLQIRSGRHCLKATGLSLSKRASKKLGENKES